MGKHIRKIIDEHRRKKSVKELERKWIKAKGRYSNQYWCAEEIDLAKAKGRELEKLFEK